MKQSHPVSGRLLPPQLFYLSAIIILIAGYLETGSIGVSYWGLTALATAILVAVQEKKRFAQEGTTIFPNEKPSTLITDGAYRYSRNPMYLAMVVGLLGLWPLTGGYSPALIVLLFAAIIQHRFILKEETNLTEAFGDDYQSYKASVRRWI